VLACTTTFVTSSVVSSSASSSRSVSPASTATDRTAARAAPGERSSAGSVRRRTVGAPDWVTVRSLH
jgi:hypothetical protein